MDQERSRIRADLLGLLEGDVLCDDLSMQMYAGDASVFEVRPTAVVRPRSTSDVVAVVKYAAEHGLSLHPRGAGSGVAGESLGSGIVLDFTRYMRRVLSEEADAVRVQPGLVLAQLNRYLSISGRMFGPDPATRSVTSIGSVIAIDGTGSHWLRYGTARRYVRRLQCVLMSGEVVELGRVDLGGEGLRPDGSPDTAWHLGNKVATVIRKHEDEIQGARRRSSVDRAGYRLHDLLDGDEIDLAKLLVGSEGTLAIVTEATIGTSPIPKRRGVVLLFFSRLETAAKAAVEIARSGADACDMMDRRLLSIAREIDPEYARVIPPDAEAMLLVEYQGETLIELNGRIQDVIQKVRRRFREPFDHQVSLETEQRNRFWRLARRVIPTLYRLKGSTRAVPFIEDIAVPPEALANFVLTAQNVLKQHQVTASVFAHAGHGQLHLRPFVDLADPQTPGILIRLAEALYAEVLAVGGSISGEHGLGLSRSWYARQQLGAAYAVMRQIKRIFDPQFQLNPGKIFSDAPEPPRRQFRQVLPQVRFRTGDEADESVGTDLPMALSPPIRNDNSLGELGANPGSSSEAPATPTVPSVSISLPVIDLNLVWNDKDLTTTAKTCNGCGRCRTSGSEERMCPIFRADAREEATPRAKANLMRAIATGQLSTDWLSSPEFKQIADLCVNCHQCRIDCPASVDIPKLMVEAKSQFVLRNGFTTSDWLTARIDLLASWGSSFAPQVNWALRRPSFRWLLEKAFGISHHRMLPKFQRRSFLREAARRGLGAAPKRGGARVVYFVDTMANWCDTELAWCVVQVLEHQGVSVHVPLKQRPSGMSLISSGAIDRARPLAEANIELLAELVRQGYEVVCSEPAATLALRHEYPNLIADSDAALVARNTYDVGEYLLRLKREERLELKMKPLDYSLAYHLPCHQRALGDQAPAMELLALVRGLQVRRVEKGCTGMAGTWGMKRENYRRSARIGMPLFTELRRSEYQATASECTACRMQISHFSRKATIHPIKVLAMAYGLLPDDKRLMRVGEMTV